LLPVQSAAADGETIFFLFTQRRKGAKPQRGLDLRGSPSLREKKEKTEIQEEKSCERLDFFAPLLLCEQKNKN
jgi:hypothetical protein